MTKNISHPTVLPDNSNFSTTTRPPELRDADKANRRPLQSGVTFSDVTSAGNSFKNSTATFKLAARDDSTSGRNSVLLRLEGQSYRGQRLDLGQIRIIIRPAKN